MSLEWVFFFFTLLGIASFAITIWAVIDIIQKPFKKKNDKILWAVVVLAIGLIGPIVYFFNRKNLYLDNDHREYLPDLEDEWGEPQRQPRYNESDDYV
jgi:hypothetical protein